MCSKTALTEMNEKEGRGHESRWAVRTEGVFLADRSLTLLLSVSLQKKKKIDLFLRPQLVTFPS